MTTVMILECLLLVLLLVSSALVSSAETALFSLDKIQVLRIRETAVSAADHIDALLAYPTRLLSSLLIINTVVNVGLATFGYATARKYFGEHAASVAIAAVTAGLVIFGEIAPKRLALLHPEKMSALYAPVLSRLVQILAPARIAMEFVTQSLARHFIPKLDALSEDEYRAVIKSGEADGILDKEERMMVHGIIRLEDIQASDVMTPRVDMVAINIDSSPKEQEEVTRSVRFHYLPVYRDTPDHIEGFLHVPRYLLSENRSVKDAMIPAFSVPENASLSSLLPAFQRGHHSYAMVVDEHGGTAGVMTLGDILEEIVDDVEGEYGESTLVMEKIGPDSWLVSGSTSLEDINYALNLELEAEGADRIAGWVTAHTAQLPRIGDVVTSQNCRVTVRQVRRNRLTTVLLQAQRGKKARK